MQSSLRLRWFVYLTSALLAGGCSGTVQEDRSINYSTDGSGVAFQHGEDGVFVASGDGKKLEKVYEGGEETIAVSSPLWSPVDKSLIFTAARPAASDNHVATEIAAWDANPEGRQFAPEEVVYTCMLRPPASEDEPQTPVALFEASCDHPGYVAANVAVRWHPAGDRVLFVDRTQLGEHSLFEFDLATKNRRKILPHSAAALIFDWTPGGSYLVCVLASSVGNPEVDGIWVHSADAEEWWRVPESEHLSTARSEAILERLRATRPAWTRDERRFAFVASNGQAETQRHAIFTADVESRTVTTLYEGSTELRDLHWDSHTGKLGFVEETEPPGLRLVDESGVVSETINDAGVRQFAGWNCDGSRLAYVAPEPTPGSAKWARLFPPVPEARDRVYVADGVGKGPGEVVHSGVRITFPQWSPKEDSLSLWGTYTPTHRSLISTFLPWTLRPGDPAAILDCDSGEMKWMAVNAHEQAQVGHYYLLRRDYEEAWRWYEQSAAGREPPRPIKLSELDQFLRQIRIHQDPTFFEYYCLTKLNRHEEAAVRLEQFRKAMTFDIGELGDLDAAWQQREDEVRAELGAFVVFATPLIRSAYITEVYLSLDAAADGISFFERELEPAAIGPERLAASLCLSQLFLIAGDHNKYAELATSKLAPLLMEMIDSPMVMEDVDFTKLPELRRTVQDFTVLIAGALALEPLASDEFLAGFTDEQCRVYLAQWRKLGEQAQNDAERLGVDSVLAAMLKQLGDDEYQQLEERVRTNPLSARFELPFGEEAAAIAP